MSDTARRYRVTGRVQGVGYRYFALRNALRLGVRGWVRNLQDGDVEVHAEASEETLERFRATLAEGPPSSRVTDIVEEPAARTGVHSSFQVRG
jgi:acylphosphatase